MTDDTAAAPAADEAPRAKRAARAEAATPPKWIVPLQDLECGERGRPVQVSATEAERMIALAQARPATQADLDIACIAARL